MSRTRHPRPRRLSTRARIQRFRPTVVGDMRTGERAVLPCGCCIYVGRRGLEGVVGTAAQPCSAEHEVVTDRSSGLLREALNRPSSKRLLVDTCRDVLSAAARETGL